MNTFIRRWLLASAGFLALDLATRRPRPRPEELTERAAAAVLELVLLDAELRGAITDPDGKPVTADEIRAMGERNRDRLVTLHGPITPGDATVPGGNRRFR